MKIDIDVTDEELEQTRMLVADAIFLLTEATRRATGRDSVDALEAITVASADLMVNRVREDEDLPLISPSEIYDIIAEHRARELMN